MSKFRKRKRILAIDGWACYLCGTPLTTENMTFDHELPRSHGGSDDDANLRAACGPCNVRKGNLVIDWESRSLVTAGEKLNPTKPNRE